MKVKDLLLRQSSNHKMALKYGDLSISFKEWYNHSQAIADIVKNQCSENSVNYGLFLPNSIEYAEAYFGLVLADKVVVPIGTKSKPLEITSTIEYHEIDLLITNSQFEDTLIMALAEYSYKVYVYVIDTGRMIVANESEEFIHKSNYIQQDGSEDDVVIMLHTSGTTSDPKRVMLTNKNLIANVESNIESLGLTETNVVLMALPMHFGYCNTAQFLTQLYLGASSIILDGIFMPKKFFQLVEAEKVTLFTAVPSMLLMLLDYRYYEKYDYSSLKYVCFGGGKMPIDKLRQLIEKYPTVGFTQTYGQTECSPRVTVLLPQDSVTKIGSVGKAIPNVQVKVVDKEEHEVANNEIGEIIVKGPNVMRGYYKKDDITQSVIHDGWIHTGDLGRFDEDGFLYLTGRIKNMIISGGINIYPEEIEQIILQHDDIEDVCVLGEEHDVLGEVPIAKIVLKRDTNLLELKRYCGQFLTDYKIPSKFIVVESLPKTYNGKVKRF